MADYNSSDDNRPVMWLQGHAVYAAHFIVLIYVVSLLVTTVFMALRVPFWSTWLLFESGAVLRGEVWRLVSYGLVNPPSLGFVIDMLMIWWFGREVEKSLGRRDFLLLYGCLYLITPLVVSALILGGCATTEPTPPPAKAAAPVVKAPAPAPVAPAKPEPAPKPAPAPAAPAAVTPPPPPALPDFKLPPPPPLPDPAKKAEVVAIVEHLTQDAGGETMAHEISDTTGFPQAIASLAPGAHAPKTEVIYIGSQPPVRGLTADGSSTDLVEKDWTGLILVPLNTSLSKAHTSSVRLIKVEAHPLSDGRVRVWIRVKNIGDKGLPTEIACIFRMQGETTPESPYFYELEVPGQAYRDVFFVSPVGQLNTYTVLVRPKYNYEAR